jgi:transposase
MNDKLSDLRRELQRQGRDEAKDVLKGTRWLLLRNPDKLERAREASARLKQALELNAPLAAAYSLEEDLRRLWNQPAKAAAARFLDGWIERARATGIRQPRQMASTLSLHRTGLLACYDVPITSGPLEGTNTRVQLLKRQACGYRDRDFSKLRIHALHESRLALVG